MLHSPVLVGTNLTPGAEGALRQAAELARDLGGRLIVCHVMPELLRIGMLFPQWRGVDPRVGRGDDNQGARRREPGAGVDPG